MEISVTHQVYQELRETRIDNMAFREERQTEWDVWVRRREVEKVLQKEEEQEQDRRDLEEDSQDCVDIDVTNLKPVANSKPVTNLKPVTDLK